MRRRLSVPIAVVVIGAASAGATPAAQGLPIPAVERLVDRNLTIRYLGHCTTAWLALDLARTAAAPIGVEFVPGPCSQPGVQPRTLSEPVSFLGLTAGEALNRLVEIDPRYSWKDTGGVLVMRPNAAWADGRHFLHRKLATFEMVDENFGGALTRAADAIWQFRGPDHGSRSTRTAQGDRRFTVRLGQVQIVDTLNAVVREHGALQWRITYCQPSANEKFAMLHFRTFDEDGLATAAGFVRDAAGKSQDLCGGRYF